jgi:hypothetical protein
VLETAGPSGRWSKRRLNGDVRSACGSGCERPEDGTSASGMTVQRRQRQDRFIESANHRPPRAPISRPDRNRQRGRKSRRPGPVGNLRFSQIRPRACVRTEKPMFTAGRLKAMYRRQTLRRHPPALVRAIQKSKRPIQPVNPASLLALAAESIAIDRPLASGPLDPRIRRTRQAANADPTCGCGVVGDRPAGMDREAVAS